MRYALIRNGVVENIVEADVITTAEMIEAAIAAGELPIGFVPPSDMLAIPAPDHVGMGSTYDGQTFAPPSAPPLTAAQLAAYAADARWRRETAGIVVSGISVFTDDRSKMMLMGARIQATADPTFSTQWKGADGQFVTVDGATITALSSAVLAHVDACFTREGEVLAAINEGEVTTLAEIEQAFADVTAPWG